jgi:hypothetical protein
MVSDEDESTTRYNFNLNYAFFIFNFIIIFICIFGLQFTNTIGNPIDRMVAKPIPFEIKLSGNDLCNCNCTMNFEPLIHYLKNNTN